MVWKGSLNHSVYLSTILLSSSPICLKCIFDAFVSGGKYQKYCSPPFPMDFPATFLLTISLRGGQERPFVVCLCCSLCQHYIMNKCSPPESRGNAAGVELGRWAATQHHHTSVETAPRIGGNNKGKTQRLTVLSKSHRVTNLFIAHSEMFRSGENYFSLSVGNSNFPDLHHPQRGK